MTKSVSHSSLETHAYTHKQPNYQSSRADSQPTCLYLCFSLLPTDPVNEKMSKQILWSCSGSVFTPGTNTHTHTHSQSDHLAAVSHYSQLILQINSLTQVCFIYSGWKKTFHFVSVCLCRCERGDSISEYIYSSTRVNKKTIPEATHNVGAGKARPI